MSTSPPDKSDPGYARRVQANARDELRGLIARLNKFLGDEDNRTLMSLAEMKVLGASGDLMSDIAKRLEVQ